MIAQELEVSLHMAFVEARQQRHEFITVEHLLLALLDNPSAAEALRSLPTIPATVNMHPLVKKVYDDPAFGEFLDKLPDAEVKVLCQKLRKGILATKIMAPPTNCLSPIGDELMRRGLVSFLNVIETEGPEEEEGWPPAGRNPARRDAVGN